MRSSRQFGHTDVQHPWLPGAIADSSDDLHQHQPGAMEHRPRVFFPAPWRARTDSAPIAPWMEATAGMSGGEVLGGLWECVLGIGELNMENWEDQKGHHTEGNL